MRRRVLFLVSLGANLILASFWFASARKAEQARLAYNQLAATTPAAGKTNVVLRRQFFSWQQVESDEYPAYIANLRQIGCPEQTIRDIIVADVNLLFARRRATELVTPQQQWWRSDPDPQLAQIAAEKSRALEDERRLLLTQLLGPNWEAGDLISLPRPSRPGVILDGPVLGSLSAETKQAVAEISARGEERLQAYLEAQRLAGKAPDQTELAKLRQQTRLELAGALSPSQLEEFLLRYAHTANNLRKEIGDLRYFNPSPDEFRAIFRATDLLDQQLLQLAGRDDAASVTARNTLEQQRENALKLALGPERFREYVQLHDPLYRDAINAAQLTGDPRSAQALYEIALATRNEQGRVQTDPRLTDAQRAIELKRIELEQLKAVAQATGHEVPPEPAPPPQPLPTRPHVIGRGETIATVSLQYGVPISAIRAANPDLDFSRLQPGNTIRIPQSFLTPQSIVPPR